MKDFELLPHTADIKVRVYGKDKKELFKNALIGMFQSVHPIVEGGFIENDRVVCAELPVKHDINISSSDEISLLVDFLSEALYLSDVHNEAYFDVLIHELSENALRATLLGAPIKGFDVVEIKAVTYHDLAITKHGDMWQVDIVFDI